MSKIIGLIGPKFSGKSTLATLLVTNSNFIRLPFAKHLKDMLRTFLSNQGLSPESISEWLDGTLKETPCPLLNNQTPRHAMQTLGTEWGRNLIHPNLWIDSWRRAVEILKEKNLNIICDDVRFVNEGNLIKEYFGGQIVLVLRKDLKTSEQHISELEWLKINYDIGVMNPIPPNSSVEETYGKNLLFDQFQSQWHVKYQEYL